MERGAFCISIDVELAWGAWDSLTPEYLAKCLELERAIVRRILSLFERHEICATWAIVGHLLELRAECAAAEVPAWFAPDIVDAIHNARTRQEIGSHSYAHIYYSQSSAEQVASDLGAARAAHDRNGLAWKSFVFPRNLVHRVDMLPPFGIKVFRSVDQGWHMRMAAWNHRLGRMANLADKLIPTAPAVVRPKIHPNGLVELPSSMLLMGRNGPRRAIHPGILELKAKRGLQRAAREKALFHLWFHPSNFYYETETQLSVLDGIVNEAARLRERNLLDVLPMERFAHV